MTFNLLRLQEKSSKKHFNSITTSDKICIHNPLCLYLYMLFSFFKQFLKNCLQCIEHAATTGLMAECTKITTQSMQG